MRCGDRANSRPSKLGTRRAFSLVELLVVTAVSGILLALLLPAVQAAREAARMVHCRNQLRQIGVALHHHHTAKGHFPAGNFAQTAGVCPGMSPHSEDRANWAITILPFLEQQSLHREYDENTYNEAPENQFVRERPVPTYVCPSDPRAPELIIPAMGPAAAWNRNVPYMSGSYRAVSGRSDGHDFLDHALMTSFPRAWRGALHLVGILGFRTECIQDITDGTSHTLMVGESITRTKPKFGTLWAYSYSFYSLSAGTPQARILWGDYARCCAAGGIGNSFPCRRGWGSPHPAGINFVTCGGSVVTIARDVDVNLLAELTTIAGHEVAQLPAR